ncbi:hypothetical protein A6E12_00675 [Aliivibrio fischeri]|uniref:transcriptional regulator n=1 Tax=Aliivibrio fischeri TaxID=668 RepID=UPI00080EDFDF|nr:winged helix-turn-helix domain-containing protein [Aliivibrio fischeri]OCH27061.1 hypothetical protein A6E12_00675 [Aliivibrio fischeri]
MVIKISDNIYFYADVNCIIIDGSEHKLEKKQSDLLIFFIHNKDVLLSKEDILNGVWEGVVSVQVVTQAIFKLRRVFKDNNIECPIITISKKGYIYNSRIFEKNISSKNNFSYVKKLVTCLFTLFLFIVFFYKIDSVHQDIDKTCSVVNCRNLVYLSSDKIETNDNGLIKLIRLHFKTNHNIDISSSELAMNVSTKRLNFNFDRHVIKYTDSKIGADSFTISYPEMFSREDYLKIMIRLEESLLIKNNHHELYGFYNELPSNKEAFYLLLSTLGSDKYSLFSKANIDKLELASKIEPENQYIVSLNYIFNFFHIYGYARNESERENEISKLNSTFIDKAGQFNSNEITPKLNEAYAMYYLSKKEVYKALEYINKTKSHERTIVGMFLTAKINKALKSDYNSELLLQLISENINNYDFQIMNNSFD